MVGRRGSIRLWRWRWREEKSSGRDGRWETGDGSLGDRGVAEAGDGGRVGGGGRRKPESRDQTAAHREQREE